MRQKNFIPACDDCNSRLCSIFSDVSQTELDILSKYKCGNSYRKDQTIFMDGTPPAGLFCINSGKVKIYKIDAAGKEQIVRLAKEGDVLGYRSLISGELYSAFATTLEDSLICFIPKDVFFNLLEANSKLSFKVMKLLSQDLQSAENSIASMAQKTVRERVAESILILKEFYGVEEDGATLQVKIKREDLANIVGTATETLIRFLSEFKKDEMIEIAGKKIKILDQPALIRTANIFD